MDLIQVRALFHGISAIEKSSSSTLIRTPRGWVRDDNQLLQLGEGAVHQVNGDGSFADGRSDAFHIAGAHVAHGKHARQAGFEHLRNARQRPSRLVRGAVEIAPRENESLVVEREAALQPLGARRSARHDEHVANGMRGCFAGLVVAPGDALEMRVAFERDDLRAIVYFDGGVLLDALDQVARHRV